MHKKIIHITIFVILMVVYMGCKQNYPSGGPYYYKSWKTYQIPFQPIEQISAEEAKKADTFYEAFFNNDGKILKFTKYINRQVEFTATYTYNQDGKLDLGEIIKKNGEKTVQHFDKNGKIIKEGT